MKKLLSLLAITLTLFCCSKDSIDTPPSEKPKLSTLDIINITTSSANSGGNVSSDGNREITNRGLVWNTTPTPSLEHNDGLISNGKGLGEFVSELTSLKDGTTYYVRAYATNEKGTAYGAEKLFTTKKITTATITTKVPSAIEFHSALCGGTVVNDGNSLISTKGIIWSTSQNPTVEENEGKIDDETQNSDFQLKIENLTDGTTYYVRAFATNTKGIAYGEELSFNTKGYSLPELTTKPVTNIKYTEATSGGNITSNGNNEITSRGIVWSTNQNPTIEKNQGTNIEGKGVGEYLSNMEKLENGTTYYVKAYATNIKGTTYGNEITFKTNKETLPQVVTTKPRGITSNSAISGGTITDNNIVIISSGVVWDMQNNPTIERNIGKTEENLSTGEYTSNITKLEKGTRYFVRAYAKSNNNIVYGEEYEFVTKNQSLPYVKTENAYGVRFTYATCAGSVRTGSNTFVHERGIIYSTSSSFSNPIKATATGVGTGDFSCTLDNLTEGTMYFYKAYASNELGTAYGEIKPFLTLKKSSPEVTTITPSDITYSTALCGGNVTIEGNPKVTERGIVWSKRPNTTINNYLGIHYESNGLGEYSYQLTNLDDATTYYVRAYTTNPIGTVYGEEKSFTTEKIEVDIEMVFVEGGTFQMGTECNSEYGCNNPIHTVTVSDFQIGKFEITKGQWQKIMESNSPPPTNGNLPIMKVSWYRVQEFISKLNKKTGEKYRLPTEAEWEFAAKGGNSSGEVISWGDIGTKKPNELGIYDMTESVDEWCSDWYHRDYYLFSKGATNPKGSKTGESKVIRGSSLTERSFYNPDMGRGYTGFRLVLDTSN